MSQAFQKFAAELDEFLVKQIPENIIIIQKKVVFELLRRFVLRTPVDTGRARGGWHVTINAINDSDLGGVDLSGSGVFSAAKKVMAALGRYETVYINNNVTYIPFLDAGSSKQAPAGMIDVSIEEVRQMFP